MSWFKKRWKYIKHYYKQKSMQFTISISFTLVTVIGMALLGIFLLRSY